MKPAYVSVAVPTNQSFTSQWHHWIYSKVAKHFKRDKERAGDTAQTVRLRLLSKDFIGRWFFKHLSNDLVDKSQAERILGDIRITFISNISPVEIPNFACLNKPCVKRHEQDRGCVRSCASSLWRVSDLLEFAKFNHERFYYSPQNHTIDSKKFLQLLGYPETQYSLLQSLYRQGRIKPAEFTEHTCVGGKCLECDRGRSVLNSRRLSLAHNWSDPTVANAASKLRWNDTQLSPFLREWARQNMVKATPLYIMRPGRIDSHGQISIDQHQGIDAGLLKYAEIIIGNEVRNDFKRMKRTDDINSTVLNNGRSPELSDVEHVSWESDDNEEKTRVLSDYSSLTRFSNAENKYDVERLINSCHLTDEEITVISKIDFDDMSIREVSKDLRKPIQKIHRIRKSALEKLRVGESTLVNNIAKKYGCSIHDMLSPSIVVGPAIIARSHFFGALHSSGVSISEIVSRYNMSEERVTSAVHRASYNSGRSLSDSSE